MNSEYFDGVLANQDFRSKLPQYAMQGLSGFNQFMMQWMEDVNGQLRILNATVKQLLDERGQK
jgi:hypothetical protein